MELPPAQPPLAYANAPTGYQAERDAEHLNLLGVFHFVWGGIMMLFSSFFILYIVMGAVLVSNPAVFGGSAGGQSPPREMAWVFVILGSVAVLIGWSMGILTIVSGVCLRRRRAWVFSVVVAGISCLSVPFGTTLGVFTFLVLLRPSVKNEYSNRSAAPRRG